MRLFFLTLMGALLANQASAAIEIQLDSGEIRTINDESVIKPLENHFEGNRSSQLLARSLDGDGLFERQFCSNPGENVICGIGCCPNDEYCCSNLGCFPPNGNVCCADGHYCPGPAVCCSNSKCCEGNQAQCCLGGGCVCLRLHLIL